MEEFLYPTLTAFSAAFIAWLFSMRKSLAENRACELDNAVKAVSYYRDLLDDINVRLNSATQRIRKMEKQNKDLITVNRHMVTELQKIKQLA